jgi:GTPase SAR1 family protein
VNWHHDHKRVLITGTSKSGKSSLAIRMARDWPARWKFFFDPDREFAFKTGWAVAIEQREIIRLASQFRPVCFDPIPMFGHNTALALDWFCKTVLDMSRAVNGVKLIGVDEIWKHTGKKLPVSLKAIMHEGRRQEIDSLIVSQQLNGTNADLRAQTTELWAFQQSDKLPLDWLEESGFDRDTVARLPKPGGFILKNCECCTFQTGRTSRAGFPSFNASDKTRKADRPAGVA